MKYTHWPFTVSDTIRPLIGNDGCRELVEHTLDRIKLRGMLPDKSAVSLSDFRMPKGEAWMTTVKAETERGWIDVGISVLHDDRGVHTFIGTVEEAEAKLGDLTKYNFVWHKAGV